SAFDAVFAHTVLQHVGEPVRALREMRRVLRPGGVIGLRDDDWGTFVMEPCPPLCQLCISLGTKFWIDGGGDPYFGRAHRRVLREAGFVRTRASSSTDCFGARDETARFAGIFLEHQQTAAFVNVVVEQGWADPATLEAMYAELRAWGERED